MTILVDPVFSGNASPVSLFAKAFPGTEMYGVEEMPEVDVLLLTHDHYDHLDYKTVRVLAGSAGKICTSLGVGAHLESWGVSKEKIVELDWWESWSWGGWAGSWGSHTDGGAGAAFLGPGVQAGRDVVVFLRFEGSGAFIIPGWRFGI